MIKDVKTIKTKKFFGDEGCLNILNSNQLPFEVKRLFWINNVPCNVNRGNHAHRKTKQIFICTAGNVSIELQDQQGEKAVYFLSGYINKALYVPEKIWVKIKLIGNGSLLVLANKKYEEVDYINDFGEFISAKKI